VILERPSRNSLYVKCDLYRAFTESVVCEPVEASHVSGSRAAHSERPSMLHLAMFHLDFAAILNAVHHFMMHRMSGGAISG